MKKYKGYVSTRVAGSRCSFEFEVEDDATEEEIEQTCYEAMCEGGNIEWWYEEDES